MPLLATGLKTETYEEILARIIAKQRELISATISNDEDTGLGQANIIVATEQALVNEGLQDAYDQRDILKAEGKALDDAVSWIPLQRQPAQPTAGEQYFVGTDGRTIPQGSLLQNPDNQENYTTNAAVTISRSSYREIKISVLSVVDSTDYTVTVGASNYTHNSGVGATATSIIDGLALLITNAALAYTGVNVNDQLVIATTDYTDLNSTITSNLRINEVTSAGNITAVTYGLISAPANSVSVILSPISGWTSTYNPQNLVIGRNLETDNELRQRALTTASSEGKATRNAIIAALLNVEGVSSAAVEEQYVSQGDNGTTGQPAGSIQCVVTGGLDNNAIAQAIFDTVGDGIEVWADDETGSATDINGDNYTIKFSRPTPVPITVAITYTVFDTDLFPANTQDAEDAMVLAVVNYGNTLSSGEDVDPENFHGQVYRAVGGISEVTVTMSRTSPSETAPPLDFLTIAPTEDSVFSTDNVTINPNP